MTDAKPLRVDAQRNREALIAKAREIFGTGGFSLPVQQLAQPVNALFEGADQPHPLVDPDGPVPGELHGVSP